MADSCSINRISNRVRKKIKNNTDIFGNIMWKNVLIMWKKRWILRKFEQLVKQRWSLGPFRCFLMYRMYRKYNEHSILPQILALFSRNKHHFCQVLYIWSFMQFFDRYFFIQHSFFIKICAKNIHVYIQNFVLLLAYHPYTWWQWSSIQTLLEKTRGMPGS